MVPDELEQELRGTWGPAPSDPERLALWERGMVLLAQVPRLLADMVITEGTPFDSLITALGSEEKLADFEVQCVERYLTRKNEETLRDVALEVANLTPWAERLNGLSRPGKSRFVSKVAEDISNHLFLVIIGTPKLMRWLFPK